MGLIKLIIKLLVLPLLKAGNVLLGNDCRMDVRHQRRSRNAPTAGSCLCGLYHPSHCRMADYQNRRY